MLERDQGPHARDLEQRRGEHVEARAARVDPAAAHDRVRASGRPARAVVGVAQREPAQVGGVEDALGLARPATRGEVRVGAPVGDVREAHDRASRRARAAARSARSVLHGSFRCSRMSAAIRTSKRPSGAAVSTSALSTRSSRRRRLARVLGLELDADDLDVLALLERGAGRAGRAAEVQHAPRGRAGRARGSPAGRARRPRRGRHVSGRISPEITSHRYVRNEEEATHSR